VTFRGCLLLVRTFVGGPIGAVAYLIADEAAGEAIVVDAPGGITKRVTAAAEKLGVRIALVVATHGHWDHIQDCAALRTATGAPVAVHAADAELLRHPMQSSFGLPFRIEACPPDRLLDEGDEIAIGSSRLQVLSTSGHIVGAICLYEPDAGVLFSGDTLFAGTYGRTDLPGGDDAAMAESLARLAALPPGTIVYPGHGPSTTIGAETWLSDYSKQAP
jgi:hydroxyacylglutathione hydrolase